MTHVDINLAEFLSVLVFLSEECGKIIRQVESSGELKQVKEKNDKSPVTNADLRVQKTLEVVLKALYPTLAVEGEESKESIADKESAVKPEQVTEAVKKFVSTEWLNKKHEARRAYINDKLRKTYSAEEIQSDNFETFNTADATVWIDPLDGTSDFVKQNLPAVTVLIGLSIKGVSKAGVVHQPFSQADESKSITYFGTAEHGVQIVQYEPGMTTEDCLKREIVSKEPFDHEQDCLPTDNIRIAASLQHFSKIMETINTKIQPTLVEKIGGAGNKCNNITTGKVDSYIHPTPGLKFWDLCAPEALIKGMGGYATNFECERIKYDAKADPNLKGLILARNPVWHKKIIERLGDERQVIIADQFKPKPPKVEAPKVEPVAEVKKEEPVAEIKKEEPVAEVKKEEPVAEAKNGEPVVEAKKEEPVAEAKKEEPAAEEKPKPVEEKKSSGMMMAMGAIAVAAVAGAAFFVMKNKNN